MAEHPDFTTRHPDVLVVSVSRSGAFETREVAAVLAVKRVCKPPGSHIVQQAALIVITKLLPVFGWDFGFAVKLSFQGPSPDPFPPGVIPRQEREIQLFSLSQMDCSVVREFLLIQPRHTLYCNV